jgi:hypothetical protein
MLRRRGWGWAGAHLFLLAFEFLPTLSELVVHEEELIKVEKIMPSTKAV